MPRCGIADYASAQIAGMDNIIYLNKNYIAGVSDEFGAEMHRHPVLEIYAACDGNSHVSVNGVLISGQIITIGAGAVHAIADSGKRGIVLFIDPLSSYGYSIQKNILGYNHFNISESTVIKSEIQSLLKDTSEQNIDKTADLILNVLKGRQILRPFDTAVLKTIDLLDKDCIEFDMDTIADKVCLSKSRLAHLFSEQTGITLKTYIQYKRMETACKRIIAGLNITAASFDTGFSSSSHIAASSKKLTGMQLRKMLNL